MSSYVNVKKKKTTRPHNVQRHAGCRNKHISSSSSTVEDSQDLQSCSPNYINIENIIKMNDSSFAWEMSADNCVSSSKCNFRVLLEWYQSHCWQPSWISKLTQLSNLVSRSGRQAGTPCMLSFPPHWTIVTHAAHVWPNCLYINYSLAWK